MRALLISFARPGFFLAFALAAACGYSPNPPSMKLICGPQMSCPDGYSCVSNTCWKQSEANLVGHWVFGAQSTQTTMCSDGSSSTMSLQGPDGFLDVVPAAPAADVSATYYCDWKLDIAGSSTVIQAAQSCSAADLSNPGVTYTWHGETLAVTSSDGKQGTLAASFPYDYVSATATGTCHLHINADLTKK
jgi:hypothetical protein